MGATTIRVMTIDDHPLLSEGIATIINAQPDMELVASAFTSQEGIRRFRELKPDVTLMDLRFPDVGGIETIIALRGEFSNARIL